MDNNQIVLLILSTAGFIIAFLVGALYNSTKEKSDKDDVKIDAILKDVMDIKLMVVKLNTEFEMVTDQLRQQISAAHKTIRDLKEEIKF